MAPITAVGALLLLATHTLAIIATSPLNPFSDEFISLINSKQNSWKAGRNFPADTPMARLRKLAGTRLDNHLTTSTLPVKVHNASVIESLPENFDPREKWTNCPTLNDIRDQGRCGSCWAHGAVETMTDRVCTYSNGKKHFYYSAQDLLSCCADCGSCDGGSLSESWEYWMDNGIVSGGSYNSSLGCTPYTISPCEHYIPGVRPPCGDDFGDTPICEYKCVARYNTEYVADKHFGKHVYLIDDNEDHIKAELFLNGPVEAAFTVYEDFLHYKSGVYSYTHGDIVYGHAVKVLGWGVENGHKYWLIANSWNTDWGDKGFFKFLRGENHLFIESNVITGEPKLDGL